MSRMRLRIAERLKESQNAAASLTTFNEIDMSSLIEMRKKFKDEVLKEHDVKLGFMSAFAKACTLALREIPSANAYIEDDEIVYHDFVDLSVAVATPKGLVTPVVRNAETMNFVQIEKEIADLGKKVWLYQNLRYFCSPYVSLRRHETVSSHWKIWLVALLPCTWRGSESFIISLTLALFAMCSSNGGVFGSLYGTPIINLPQAAVLGAFFFSSLDDAILGCAKLKMDSLCM